MIAEALARPITDLIAQAGTGDLGACGADTRVREGSSGIAAAMRTGVISAGAVGAGWQGADADACARLAAQAGRAGAALVEQGDGIATVLADAAAGVRRGVGELGGILDSFLAVVACQGPALLTPAGQVAVVAAAADHVEQALAVVARMRGELEAHAAELAPYIPQVPLPAMPDAGGLARFAEGLSQAGADLTGQVRAAAVDAWGDVKGRVDAFFEAGADDAGPPTAPGSGEAAVVDGPCPPGCTCPACAGAADGAQTATAAAGGAVPAGAEAGAGFVGGGADVRLPNGDVVTAPNAEAADAVRAALTQRGVPYSWGGTDPGEGLDCSGLTQWAYGQAGVDLPRLAENQSVGMPVPADALAPGDLAVWDGHVAMVLGDGRMIEAGDPVQVSSLRTTNADMQFQGFYRPTAG
ncbi:C40 family peptidase [Tomitella fengzijianii]|uniref:NlpC/P60 family protein n=1 Tax=Tomitella fengzijianii TaxID=2597660 RepID=A0A516X5J9_9ACTN|nr:C40 family peptidase [Tomitella fengzijianii]QDQ98347.1 NlpC/P60 family protein [Tomitella fengzijianii]